MEPMTANNFDGWGNLLSGLATRQDKTSYNRVVRRGIMTDQLLTDLWIEDGIAREIASMLPEDAVRSWIEIPLDEEGKLWRALEALGVKATFQEALCWARLYGGAIVVMGINDGSADLSKPIRRAGPVEWLKVYPRPRINLQPYDIVTDPRHPLFEDWETVELSRMDGTLFRVHRSRCLVFKGESIPPVPGAGEFEAQHWGMSCLQGIHDNLGYLALSERSIAVAVQEFAVGKMKVEGLAALLASNNSEAVHARLTAIQTAKSVINAVIYGENEDYTHDVVPLTGLPEILREFREAIAAISGYPYSRLFGRRPGGLSSSGDEEARSYYDRVKSYQESVIQLPLLQLVQMVNEGIGSPIDPDKLELSFVPVWTPSQSEEIDNRLKQSQTDSAYIQLGVLLPDEVRASRFENGYSHETAVSGEADGWTGEEE